MGPWGTDAKKMKMTAAIGKRIRQKSGGKRYTPFLFQRISLEIQKGNVESIFGTMPSKKYFSEFFVMLRRRFSGFWDFWFHAFLVLFLAVVGFIMFFAG